MITEEIFDLDIAPGNRKDKTFTKFEAYIFLLIRVSKEQNYNIYSLSHMWNWSRSKVRNFIEYLDENSLLICDKKDNKKDSEKDTKKYNGKDNKKDIYISDNINGFIDTKDNKKDIQKDSKKDTIKNTEKDILKDIDLKSVQEILGL